MRVVTLVIALAIAAPAIAPPAHAFVEGFRLRISPAANGDFLVGFDSLADLTDYWCAAGNYVTTTLGMPDRTRVFRASPEPRKAGQGISFTLDPARSSGTTGLSTFGGPQDGSMSAGGAQAQFCNPFDF